MISAKQIKAARVFLDWEQRHLAEHSGLSLPTIQRMEKLGLERSSVANAQKVQAALEAAGIIFIPRNGGGPGVRLRDAAGPAGTTPPPSFAATIGTALGSMSGKAGAEPEPQLRTVSPEDEVRGGREVPEE